VTVQHHTDVSSTLDQGRGRETFSIPLQLIREGEVPGEYSNVSLKSLVNLFGVDSSYDSRWHQQDETAAIYQYDQSDQNHLKLTNQTAALEAVLSEVGNAATHPEQDQMSRTENRAMASSRNEMTPQSTRLIRDMQLHGG
jgi:hypothetical protein